MYASPVIYSITELYNFQLYYLLLSIIKLCGTSVLFSKTILTLCIPGMLPILIILPGESTQKCIFMMAFGGEAG